MRRVSRIAIGVSVAAVVIGSVVSPVAADTDLRNPHSHPHASGGSSSNAIWVSVGASGGPKRGYKQCPWEPGWPSRTGITEVRDVPGLVGIILSMLGSRPFGGSGDPATVTLVPESEADLDGDGEIDEGFVQPIINGEDGYVIGETEGVGWVNNLMLRIRGTHDLGVFIGDPYAGEDLDDLTEEQRSGDRYRQSGSFPLVQRGKDPLGNTDLWWDPWFISPEAAEGTDCDPGLIYSPRVQNPGILLPDLQRYVSDLLPPAAPILIPLDEREGWAYVQVPTNFAVTSSSLEQKSAHAEVEYIDDDGNSSPLWADIVAIPTHLMFDPGDGSEPVVCHLSQMRFEPDDPGDCSHVYLDSSNVVGGKFQGRVSVLWVGQYTDSIGGNALVDIVPTTASFDIAVAEARTAVSSD